MFHSVVSFVLSEARRRKRRIKQEKKEEEEENDDDDDEKNADRRLSTKVLKTQSDNWRMCWNDCEVVKERTLWGRGRREKARGTGRRAGTGTEWCVSIRNGL